MVTWQEKVEGWGIEDWDEFIQKIDNAMTCHICGQKVNKYLGCCDACVQYYSNKKGSDNGC